MNSNFNNTSGQCTTLGHICREIERELNQNLKDEKIIFSREKKTILNHHSANTGILQLIHFQCSKEPLEKNNCCCLFFT